MMGGSTRLLEGRHGPRLSCFCIRLLCKMSEYDEHMYMYLESMPRICLRVKCYQVLQSVIAVVCTGLLGMSCVFCCWCR